MEAAVGR